ncbi:MAG: FlgD immunoglobulin-like domain containing protein [bacterium]
MSNASFFARCCRHLALIAAVLPTQAAAQWAANGAAVCVASGSQTEPAIATDGANGAIIGWTDGRNVELDIYAQRVDATGTPLWSGGGVPVCSVAGDQTQLATLKDFAGGATFFWADQRNPSPGIYAQRLNGTGLTMWPQNGVALSTHAAGNSNVLAIQDLSSGHLVPRGYLVAWLETGAGGLRSIRAQHVDVEAGGLWTSAAVGGALICGSANSTKSVLVMDTDGAPGISFLTGGAILAWEESRGGDLAIWARRVDAGGTPQWTADGIRVCGGTTGQQRDPAIANVGGDDCIVTWSDTRSGSAEIYAQRIDSTGTLFWAADGVSVCNGPGARTAPAILKDGAGGAFIAWLDTRTGSTQIYGQRITENGARQWVLLGVPVCTAASNPESLTLLSDGAGGFFAVWRDHRNDSGDIYAQRVDANGLLQWSASGVPLSLVAGAQIFPAIVAGAGGLIAAWQDGRNPPFTDIYANRVTTGGGITSAPVVEASTALLSLVSENPTRRGAQFRLALPESRTVTMEVCDVTGRRVRSVASARALGAGTHSLAWDGTDDVGSPVAAGVYFVRLAAGDESETSRVVVVR